MQHEVDLHLAGGRVLAAGGVAAQRHAVAALRARRSGRPVATRGQRGVGVADPRDEQVDRRAGGRDGVRGAGEHHPAHRRRHVGDGDDGEHVDRAESVRCGRGRQWSRRRPEWLTREPGGPGTGRPGRLRGNGVDRAGDRGRVPSSRWVARSSLTSVDADRCPSTSTLRDEAAPAIAPGVRSRPERVIVRRRTDVCGRGGGRAGPPSATRRRHGRDLRRVTTSPGRATAARPRAPSNGRSPRTPRRPAARSGPARTTRSTRSRARRAGGPRCTSPAP